jgi:hypothetical protein
MKIFRVTVAVSLMAALLASCGQGCENEVSQSVASPSGQLKAVVFHRGCGATTGFNTQMSVIRSGDSLANDGGNVLIIEGKVPIQIQWPSEERISVSRLGSAKVFKQERSAAGIAVAYQ